MTVNIKESPKIFYWYVNCKQVVKDKVGPTKDKEGDICLEAKGKVRILNEYFVSVFTKEEDADKISVEAEMEEGMDGVKIDGQNLEEQLKINQRELAKKDEVIRTLTRLRYKGDGRGLEKGKSAKVTFVPPVLGASPPRDPLPYYGQSVDTLHSEYTALLVKYKDSENEVTELRDRLSAKEVSLLQLKGELERYKENNARQASLIQSLNDRMRHTQELSDTVASVKTQENCSIRSLQGENQELRERISELEERLRLHLREREQSEQKAVCIERRLTTGIEKLAHSLNIDPKGQRDPLDYLTSKASKLFQEHLLWETKMVTLEETLANQELEFKASRQTLMKLVSDAGKAQQMAASYSEDMNSIRKERNEALLLKKSVEQENKLLHERLEDCQRALGTACQAQAFNEKHVSDLDDRLRSSTYQTRASNVLHQSFIDQLAALLSNGYISVPATEEAIKNKVKEICGNDRTHIAKVKELEEQITKVNEQLEHQGELYHRMLGRARRAEEKLNEREEALRHLEGQLAAEDLLKGGRQFERQKHVNFLQQLAESMKVEQDTLADDWESQSQRLLARAQQLTGLEVEGLSGNQELLHTLQNKVTSQREKLKSSKRQIELLTAKLGQLEARTPAWDTMAGHREKDKALSKLQQKMQRLQEELSETKITNQSLRAKCAEIITLKAKTKEQNRTIEKLSESLEKLETIKEKAAQKVVTLKSELDQAEHGAWERNEQTQDTLTALSNELCSTKRVLQEVARRERQLVHFREFVTRALGFDTNSMAVPDERIYLQLKGLVQTQRSRSPTALHSDSLQQGIANGFGVRYVGSWPSHSPPPDWDQRRSQPSSPLRNYSRAAQ
ncbi:coiled-coil domain-containing protein 170-like [Heterodontus francisci]|uniref:coiled-coil domain-containing protein 170-like n=1 Tax=Heterodontus francisci TaxID=7792 RepID=UPI00355B05B7